MARQKCARCGKEQYGVLNSKYEKYVELDGEPICKDCLKAHKKKIEESIILTTTNNIDGHRVISYIDIGSVEVVIGTGLISEFTGGLVDIFGERSTAFEIKLKKLRKLLSQN